MSSKLKILIVDDHAIVRDGLAAILKFQKDMTVVGEADDGQSAIQKAQELRPDIILMDLMMPNMNGTDATAAIKRILPNTQILILTSYGTSSDLSRAFKNGATGAITKSLPKEELLAAIRNVANGTRVASSEIEQTLKEEADMPSLTPRQLEILHSLTRGLTNDDIAREFGLSKAGVKFHLLTVFRKLNVANRSEAVSYALRHHLVRPDPIR
ncbi:MAG: response regulator transcription factor [Kiritimatiellae bacterium]|nr:response regulator transcription factor [Kiritimatiellia bacterium]MBQ6329115.1 response regulator transcription factor [Kiritimatiellia bacterium]